MEHVALATQPEFQDIFVDAMSFLGPGAQVVSTRDEAVGLSSTEST
jgi:hypothetical protein